MMSWDKWQIGVIPAMQDVELSPGNVERWRLLPESAYGCTYALAPRWCKSYLDPTSAKHRIN